MQYHKLYTEEPRSVFSLELDLNSDCTRCSKRHAPHHRCIPDDGTPGGYLIVGQGPGVDEVVKNRVNVGQSGKVLRSIVDKYSGGKPVVYSNATRCFAPAQTENDIEACRPYLARTIREVEPKIIIALGSAAVYSLTGRNVQPMSVRGGYTWIRFPHDAPNMTPVYFAMHPAAGLRNPLVLQMCINDLQWIFEHKMPLPLPLEAEYGLVETEDDAEVAIARLLEGAPPWVAYDLEWAGSFYAEEFEVVSAAVCSSGCDDSFVWTRTALHNEKVRAPLLRLLSDPSIPKIGHNIKGDNLAIHSCFGTTVCGTCGDTRLWRRLLESDVNGKLAICAELVGMGGHKEENDEALAFHVAKIKRLRREQELTHVTATDWKKLSPSQQRKSNKLKVAKANDNFAFMNTAHEWALDAAVQDTQSKPEKYAYALVDTEIRDRYCARDAVSTARLGDVLYSDLRTIEPLSKIWDDVVSKATDTIYQIESWGIHADKAAILLVKDYLEMELRTQVKKLSVWDFDPESPQSTARLLFEKLGLESKSSTKGGAPSTDAGALRLIKDKHPVVQAILEYRKISTAYKNYGKTLAGHIRKDGRIHPQLKIDGTRSGRLSCKDPPLHGLPGAGDYVGKLIKQCFRAPDGFDIGVWDYSQIELRIAAMLSRDKVMIEMFRSGEDFHTATAKLISQAYWGIPPEEVGPKHRKTSKSFNFGLLYGMTDHGLAVRIGCSEEEAHKLRKLIMGAWGNLAEDIARCLADARRTGQIWTWWAGNNARCRQAYRIMSQDKKTRKHYENAAYNTRVQGTASEFMLASLNKIVDWIRTEEVPAKVVLTVHDSVVLEVASHYFAEVSERVNEIMLSHDSCGVPLRVDVQRGKSLGDLEDFHAALPQNAQ
jgi:uracil-DNA glycosylase family 4